MPSHHCMARRRVAGLLIFLYLSLSFVSSCILAFLLSSSLLFFDFNDAVIVTWLYSVEWLDYSWKLNGKECWEGSGGVQPSWTAWTLKVGLVGCPETSITNYQSALRNMPEDSVVLPLSLLVCDNPRGRFWVKLKSNFIFFFRNC
jgi:hypothetical protein